MKCDLLHIEKKQASDRAFQTCFENEQKRSLKQNNDILRKQGATNSPIKCELLHIEKKQAQERRFLSSLKNKQKRSFFSWSG